MLNHPRISLGESLEASRAAMGWIEGSESKKIECQKLGKELMDRLTPLFSACLIAIGKIPCGKL